MAIDLPPHVRNSLTARWIVYDALANFKAISLAQKVRGAYTSQSKTL